VNEDCECSTAGLIVSRSAREKSMKKQEVRKLQLNKDTLRHLESALLGQALGGEPTTTVLTHWRTCTC
jgi:hypothetical protein